MQWTILFTEAIWVPCSMSTKSVNVVIKGDAAEKKNPTLQGRKQIWDTRRMTVNNELALKLEKLLTTKKALRYNVYCQPLACNVL